MTTKYKPPSSLKELMAAPKGNLQYEGGEAFLLHVFWEAPSLAAANELLAGLAMCANASRRDTPCVPTYFYRISVNDTGLCEKALTVGKHTQLSAAKKKLLRGIPAQAVHAELLKRRIDPALLNEDDEFLLPESQQVNPVALEFTEVYLDEQAFMEHAGSRDYLDGYGIVMNPAMHYQTPQTFRLGTPNDNIIEKILEPILHENVAPLEEGCKIWQSPESHLVGVFLSLDFVVPEGGSNAEVVAGLPSAWRGGSASTLVAFTHPLREHTCRVMLTLPQLPSQEALDALVTARPLRGEAHVQMRSVEEEVSGEDSVLAAVDLFRAALQLAGLEAVVLVNSSPTSGYILHEKATELVVKAHP